MERPTVVLLGRVGHGKTYLFNKLCGTRHLSAMCAGSCTREAVEGYTLKYKLRVIDTPGFASSDSTETHIEAQRHALESRELSGIMLIVKMGSPSDMASSLNHLMDFAGTENVSIIVTHTDVAPLDEPWYDNVELQVNLARLLGVLFYKILLIGKDTGASIVEDFIACGLHSPIRTQIDRVQLTYASTFTVGARRFKLDIQKAKSKIDVALQSCQAMLTVFKDDLMLRELLVRVCDEAARLLDENLRRLGRESESLSPEIQKSLQTMIEESLQPSLEKLKHLQALFASGPARSIEPNPQTRRPPHGMTKFAGDAHLLGSRHSHGSRECSDALINSLETPASAGSGRVERSFNGRCASEAAGRDESPRSHEIRFHRPPPTDYRPTSGDKVATSKESQPDHQVHDPMVGPSIAARTTHSPATMAPPNAETARPDKGVGRPRILRRDSPAAAPRVKSSASPPPPPPWSHESWETFLERHRPPAATAAPKLDRPDATSRALNEFLNDGGCERGCDLLPYGPQPLDASDDDSLISL